MMSAALGIEPISSTGNCHLRQQQRGAVRSYKPRIGRHCRHRCIVKFYVDGRAQLVEFGPAGAMPLDSPFRLQPLPSHGPIR